MNKFVSTLIAVLISGLSTSLAGYTTYSANNGYQQPHRGYIPYYHGNLGYDYHYHYLDNDSYRYEYDIRYHNNNYYVDNRIVHTDTYHINAHEVNIDNNHYYGNYGPYRNKHREEIIDILHNIPAPEECQTHRHQPRHDDYFADLRLAIPQSLSSIQKYRIRRSDGDRSQWYIPGKNDVDQSRYGPTKKLTPQRMRAYFRSYEHEITKCSHPISKSYIKQNNYYYPKQSDGHYTHQSYANGYQQRYRETITAQQPENYTKYRRSDKIPTHRNSNQQGNSGRKIYEYHSSDSH